MNLPSQSPPIDRSKAAPGAQATGAASVRSFADCDKIVWTAQGGIECISNTGVTWVKHVDAIH